MKKARTCLYVDRQDDFTRVSPLLELPGDLRLAISGVSGFLLSQEWRLSGQPLIKT